LEGLKRISNVYFNVMMLAYEGYGEEREAYAILRKGTFANNPIRDARAYKLLNKIDRELTSMARQYEGLLDFGGTIRVYCDVCGKPIKGDSDGTTRCCASCREAWEEFLINRPDNKPDAR